MGAEPAGRAVVIVVHEPSGLGGSYLCDVRDLTVADERSLDALARLQVAARRLGSSIRLRHASPALVDLIELAGLTDVLKVEEVESSGVEMDRQAEEREVRGIDEEVDPGDGTV